MKKIVALMLVLTLCLSMTALAAAPSKKPGDTTGTTTQTENPAPENAPAFSMQIVSDLTMDAEQLDKLGDYTYIADAEAEKLAGTTVEEYFGEVKDAEGNAVDLQSLVTPNEDGTAADLSVYEFYGLIASNYDESMGKVTVNFAFPTPYEVGEKVGVMIGKVNKLVDDIRDEETLGDKWDIEWLAFQGTVVENPEKSTEGVEELSTIEVELDPATVLAVQEGTALIAVVSKTVAAE